MEKLKFNNIEFEKIVFLLTHYLPMGHMLTIYLASLVIIKGTFTVKEPISLTSICTAM